MTTRLHVPTAHCSPTLEQADFEDLLTSLKQAARICRDNQSTLLTIKVLSVLESNFFATQWKPGGKSNSFGPLKPSA